MKKPSVTTALRAAQMIPTGPWYTTHARDRGTAVHLATALDDRGELDESTVDPEVWPRLLQWRKFKRESRVEIVDIELAFEHERYTGHVDRIVKIKGKTGPLDIKPPGHQPWHKLQLAGYAMHSRYSNRWNLYLGDDNYTLISYPRVELPRDYYDFIAAVRCWQWRLDHGLMEGCDGEDDSRESRDRTGREGDRGLDGTGQGIVSDRDGGAARIGP